MKFLRGDQKGQGSILQFALGAANPVEPPAPGLICGSFISRKPALSQCYIVKQCQMTIYVV